MRSPQQNPDSQNPQPQTPPRQFPRRGSDRQEWIQNWGTGLLFLLFLGGYGLVSGALPFLAGVYAAIVAGSLSLWTILDGVLGARLLAEFPVGMWIIWGAIWGGALGFWLQAPIHGWRSKRSLVLLIPLGLMLVCGVLSLFLGN